jgi:hypothetical protein
LNIFSTKMDWRRHVHQLLILAGAAAVLLNRRRQLGGSSEQTNAPSVQDLERI